MLTEREKAEVGSWTGLPDDRVRALLVALLGDADAAHRGSLRAKANGDTHQAAMLGGKATALRAAARMVEHVRAGYGLRPGRLTRAYDRHQAFLYRRAERRLRWQMQLEAIRTQPSDEETQA